MEKAANKGGSLKVAFIALAVIIFVLANSQKAQAQATTTTVIPFSASETSPCTGEDVSVNGQTVMIEQFTVGLDGRLHTHFNFNTKGSGVVISSVNPARIGAKYTFSDMQEDELNGLFPPFEVTDVVDQRMIAAAENAPLTGEFGGGDDYFFHFNVHVTVNANGVLTAFADNPILRCQ
jgi:hypothetical protein